MLIFDECHHARKSHPYNFIMTEFYHNKTMAKPERPIIFGMTASPAKNSGPKHEYSARYDRSSYSVFLLFSITIF